MKNQFVGFIENTYSYKEIAFIKELHNNWLYYKKISEMF